MTTERRVQQFARLPTPGRVKTRLQAVYSAEEACAVHVELMQRTAATIQGVDRAVAELWLDSAGEHPAIDWAINAGLEGPYLQSGADLGERMAHAMAQGLRRASKVVLVGSDCPTLDVEYVRSAFDALDSVSVVIGPAEDGGFVLVGCTGEGIKPLAEAFVGVSWGGSDVLNATLIGLQAQGGEASLLRTLYDIDTAADLRRWHHERNAQG